MHKPKDSKYFLVNAAMARVIGLLGKAGSGKNFVADLFAKKNFTVFDLDRIGHQKLEEQRPQLRQIFPQLPQVFDRRDVARLISGQPQLLTKLEELLHPLIKNTVVTELKNHRLALIQGAVLEKIGLIAYCDQLLWLETPVILRLYRLWRRDRKRSWRSLLNLLTMQSQLVPPDLPHCFLLNNGYLSRKTHLERQLDSLIEKGYLGRTLC